MFLPFHIQETPLLEPNSQKLLDQRIYLKTKLEAIKTYYYQAYLKADTLVEKKSIAKEYAHCNKLIKRILSGQITAQEAAKELPASPKNDKSAVISHNLLKACEILFHTGIASLAYIGGMFLAAPLMFAGITSGFALSVTAAVIFTAAIYCASVCFSEFQSFDKKHEVRTHLKDIFTFFGNHSNTKSEVEEEPSPALNIA